MRRTLSVCALFLVLPLVARADEAPAPTETVIRLTVRPMPAPKPALKYQLLPELREMQPGNPIQGYLKCFMEQNNFFYAKQSYENRAKWELMPLKDLPLKEMRNWGYGAGGPLARADEAARLDTPDWQILLKLKSEGINLLLPDVQVLRNLASGLKVRFRLEVAERRFDDAIVTAKTLFALSRHLGEHPSIIGNLVAMAIASLTLTTVDEMLQQPGCPNLFWALTDLPSPFIDLRHGMQGEGAMLVKEFGLIDERTAMSEEQLRKVIQHYGELARSSRDLDEVSMKKAAAWLTARSGDADYLREARKRLKEFGVPAEAAEKFPALQVVLLDKKFEVAAWRDDMSKAMRLPYWQATEVFAANPELKKDEQRFLTFLLIPYSKVKLAQTRVDQRMGLLRCVEALRLHAAEHDGKLPAKLDDMKLPLPVDPVTGKPFDYKLDGDTGTVRGTPPRGMEKRPEYNVRYELTITK
jgi:hypothetical protein